MGVCGSKSQVVMPISAEKSPSSGAAAKSSEKPAAKKPAVQKAKTEDTKPIEFRADPALTEEQREERRKRLAEAAEQRKKEELTKGMTKEGTVEYEYMLRHQRDLEKYKKLDDGKNLDWNGS